MLETILVSLAVVVIIGAIVNHVRNPGPPAGPLIVALTVAGSVLMTSEVASAHFDVMPSLYGHASSEAAASAATVMDANTALVTLVTIPAWIGLAMVAFAVWKWITE